jgi:hypothetical protein
MAVVVGVVGFNKANHSPFVWEFFCVEVPAFVVPVVSGTSRFTETVKIFVVSLHEEVPLESGPNSSVALP